MTANSDLMSEAKKSLEGNWGIAIGTYLVYVILVGALGAIPFVGTPISLVIGGPLALGMIIFSKNIANDNEVRLEQVFDGFKQFGTSLATYLLAAVATVIGFMLLIIPGILLSLGLAMSLYIISDDHEIGAYDALKKSYEMMKGYKLKLFGLGLMFFGLALLCILTLGIGFFFLAPFTQVTMVKFYQDVKADYEGTLPPAEPVLE